MSQNTVVNPTIYKRNFWKCNMIQHTGDKYSVIETALKKGLIRTNLLETNLEFLRFIV